MRPSDLAVIASSSACWIFSAATTSSPSPSTSTESAKAKPFFTALNDAWSLVRRSLRVFLSSDSPFSSNKSKAKTITAGPPDSPSVTSFFLVLSRWKGSKAPVDVSTATTSASSTNEVVVSTQASRSTAATSGHFFVVSCKFLEKTRTDPSLARWAWNRSPSYLCSQVKALPDNLLRTSSTDLVGLASMGKTGTPTPNAHFVCKFHNGVVRAPWHNVEYEGASA
mmetsp:Transcript_10102/g.26792  ORF Transcript_10102/g.26792 Transcript_10102/m.26792 type:complete len:224 (+) Transcript_10102:602-1273(+)